jgi:hypothetical protein
MPGFSPVTQALQVRNANTVEILIGDLAVAFAQTTGHQIAWGTEQLYGIGSAKPQEIQQLRISPAFTLDQFALTNAGQNLLQAGASLSYLLAGRQYNMHVYDALTNTVVFTYVGCKCQNFGESIPANTPVRDTYSFLAMDVLDPDGNSILDDGNNALQINPSGLAIAPGTSNALGLSA